MTPEKLEYIILLGLLIVVGGCMVFTLIRTIIGPKIGDRMMAVNMTNTLAVIALADIAVIADEGYIADVCLLYAAIGLLSVAALCRVFISSKRHGGNKNDG